MTFRQKQWNIDLLIATKHFSLFSCPVAFNSSWLHGLQHACPSPSPRVCPSSCHFISDAIQPSHPLMPSSSALNLSQHQGLLWVGSLHQVTKILELQLVLPMSIQWWFPLRLTNLISLLSKALSEVFFQHHISKASILWCSAFFTITTIHDHQKE